MDEIDYSTVTHSLPLHSSISFIRLIKKTNDILIITRLIEKTNDILIITDNIILVTILLACLNLF